MSEAVYSVSMQRTQIAIYILIGLALLGSLGTALWQGNWSTLFLVAITIVLAMSPLLMRKTFNIEIGRTMQFGFVLFLFSTIFLGEIRNYYSAFVWWDAALHFWAGFGLTVFGFAILLQLYSEHNVTAYPFPTSLYAFSFTGMLLGAWELFEFIADRIRDSVEKMQPSLEDTMYDLLIGYVAALIFSYLGYRYLKQRENNVAAKAIEDMDLDVEDHE